MAEFINTIDALGDEVVIDSIIDRTITEFKDDQITTVGRGAFYGCAALETVDLPNAATIVIDAFRNCTSLASVDLPNVTNLSMNSFRDCTSLENANLPKATNIPGHAFLGCTALANYPHMSKLTGIGSEAFGGTLITEAYLPLIVTLGGSLRGMPRLTVVDLPICTKIGALTFYTDLALKAVILRSSTLCTLDNTNAFLGSWEGNGVSNGNYTPIYYGTGYIYVPGNLIDSYRKATNWSTYANQFRGIIDGDEAALQGITNETLVNYENNSITSIPQRAFYNYQAIKSVKSTSVQSIGNDAFHLCSGLTEIDFPELISAGTYALSGIAVEKVCLPKLDTASSFLFRESNLLHTVDLPVVTKVNSWAFCNPNMATLILRNTTTVATCGGDPFVFGSNPPIAQGTGYIYVPRALVDSYKAATNWSTYADQFRALEDYTVDGTTTGALDESKI